MDGQIVMHCSVKGKKLDIIRKNPKCSVAVNRHADKVKYHAEKQCHYRYHSVIVTGKAGYIESEQDRIEWIKKYRDYFNQRLDWIMPAGNDIKSAKRCGIIVVNIESMTGRKEEGPDKDADEAIDK